MTEMNRKSFFKKLGIGIGVVIAAPKVLEKVDYSKKSTDLGGLRATPYGEPVPYADQYDGYLMFSPASAESRIPMVLNEVDTPFRGTINTGITYEDRDEQNWFT